MKNAMRSMVLGLLVCRLAVAQDAGTAQVFDRLTHGNALSGHVEPYVRTEPLDFPRCEAKVIAALDVEACLKTACHESKAIRVTAALRKLLGGGDGDCARGLTSDPALIGTVFSIVERMQGQTIHVVGMTDHIDPDAPGNMMCGGCPVQLEKRGDAWVGHVVKAESKPP